MATARRFHAAPAVCFGLILLSTPLLAGPSGTAAADPDGWPVAAAVAPDAGDAAAVVVWLDGGPDDADAAADRSLLGSPALRSRVDALAAYRLPWPEGGVQNRPALARHAALADAWGVGRLPAWVLLDPEGRVFARFDEGTAIAANADDAAARIDAALATLAKRDRHLAAAAGAQGLERARRLGDALDAVEPFAVSHHADLVGEAIRLDPDDEAGLRSRWWAAWAEPRVNARLEAAVFPLIEQNRPADARTALLAVAASAPLPPSLERKLAVFAAQLRYSTGDASGARAEVAAVIDSTPPGEEADAYAELLSTMADPG